MAGEQRSPTANATALRTRSLLAWALPMLIWIFALTQITGAYSRFTAERDRLAAERQRLETQLAKLAPVPHRLARAQATLKDLEAQLAALSAGDLRTKSARAITIATAGKKAGVEVRMVKEENATPAPDGTKTIPITVDYRAPFPNLVRWIGLLGRQGFSVSSLEIKLANKALEGTVSLQAVVGQGGAP